MLAESSAMIFGFVDRSLSSPSRSSPAMTAPKVCAYGRIHGVLGDFTGPEAQARSAESPTDPFLGRETTSTDRIAAPTVPRAKVAAGSVSLRKQPPPRCRAS
jgi:hypothetical protein